MRYDDWDVLLFPWDFGTPLKEFKVECHLVQDPEFSTPDATVGLPTMTCFIPSLEPNEPFHISVHSWVQEPELSAFTKALCQHPELIKFQARVYFDGCLVGSKLYDGSVTWPQVMSSSTDVGTNGESGTLRFPVFLSDMLHQNSWSAADDLGRIKVIIGEVFSPGTATVETVKNIVSFSFQHAPLPILEAATIAWPSQSLWLEQPEVPSRSDMFLTSRGRPFSHAHSSRRPKPRRACKTQEFPSHGPLHAGSLIRRNTEPNSELSALSRFSPHLPLSQVVSPGCPNSAYQPPAVWANNTCQPSELNKSQGNFGHRQNADKSSSDTSMPDCTSMGQGRQNSWLSAKQNAVPGVGEVEFSSFNKVTTSQSRHGFQGAGMASPFLQFSSSLDPRTPVSVFNASFQQQLAGDRAMPTPVLAQSIPLPLSAMGYKEISVPDPEDPDATPLGASGTLNVASRPEIPSPMPILGQKPRRAFSGGFTKTTGCGSPLGRFRLGTSRIQGLDDEASSSTVNSSTSITTPHGSVAGSLTQFQLSLFDSTESGQDGSKVSEQSSGAHFSEEAILEALSQG